jgi:hypothetical protein
VNEWSGLSVDPFKGRLPGKAAARYAITRLFDGDHLKMTRFSPHDLRRTVDTGLARLGIPEDVQKRVLNHAPQGVTAKHYNRHAYEAEKRHALKKGSAHIEAVTKAATVLDKTTSGDEAVGINHTSVQRIWVEAGLKPQPHREKLQAATYATRGDHGSIEYHDLSPTNQAQGSHAPSSATPTSSAIRLSTPARPSRSGRMRPIGVQSGQAHHLRD